MTEYKLKALPTPTTEEIIRKFREQGLRVTTPRIAVYKAILSSSHPDADSILRLLKEEYPHITSATVYNNLEALEKAGLIHKVLTDKGSMKYDGILEEHHHLLDTTKDEIIDYFDPELTTMLNEYFRERSLKDFEVSRITVQIIGKHLNKSSQK